MSLVSVEGSVEQTVGDESIREVVLADRLGAKVSCEAVLRLLALAWFVPAAAQFVLGAIVAFNLSPGVEARSGRCLELIWAAVVVLGALTLVVGSMWVVRTWDHLPPAASVRTLRVHGIAALAACAFVPLALVVRSAAPSLLGASLVLLTASALVAASFVPLWLLSVANPVVGPIAAFVGLVVWHLTVGWLHLLGPTLTSALVLAWQGAALAIGAVTVARLLPRFTATDASVPTVEALSPELSSTLERIEASVLGVTVD